MTEANQAKNLWRRRNTPMGGCQHYGYFWDAYYNTASNIQGTQKTTTISTTTPMEMITQLPFKLEIQSSELFGLRPVLGPNHEELRVQGL